MTCVGRFYITHLNKHIPMKIYAIYFCFREGLKFPRTFQHKEIHEASTYFIYNIFRKSKRNDSLKTHMFNLTSVDFVYII